MKKKDELKKFENASEIEQIQSEQNLEEEQKDISIEIENRDETTILLEENAITENNLSNESKKYGLKNSSYPMFSFSEDKILYKINYLLRKLEYYTNTNKRIRKIIAKIKYTKLTRKYMISMVLIWAIFLI